MPAGACPFGHGAQDDGTIAPGDELHLPMHKRVVVQYGVAGDGRRELHLYCGPREVVFDEPELFSFGETLGRHSSFVARSVLQWGEGYEWPRMRELLQQLVAEGVLLHGEAAAAARPAAREGQDQPSPLPPAPGAHARGWDECEAITRELTGRALEPGYLELVVPVFRVGHIAVDAEGRQVGEANVFPRPLRIEVPTRWRTCIYPGSRYLDDKPMNVSALKAMRAHWPQAMAALLRVREAYLRRYPAARAGMTLGDVERLSTLVLAVATYPLVKASGRVASGGLHPVLSAMFRVTDGLRMTSHQMLFVPVAEATLSPDTPVTAAQVHAYAERNESFHSTQGVCAGPTAMVEQFLRLLVEGVDDGKFAGRALDEAVEQALADLEPALDYGLLGLQAHAAIFSLWPLMTRTYARMARIVQDWSGTRTPAVERLDAYLREKAEILKNQTYHATEEWRVNRERVYADIYVQCARGLGDPVRQSLPERTAGRQGEQHREAGRVLRSALQRACLAGPGSDAGDVDWLVECLMHAFVRTQELLNLGCEIQERINRLLGRAQPQRPFTADDVDIHVLLQAEEARRLPHLIGELETLFGLRVRITREAVEIVEGQGPGAPAACPAGQDCRHGAGNAPCDPHTTPERKPS
jgi:hypothetical protein